MSIDHRGFDVFMPEEFLDRADIIAAFYKMCRERMPESMASGPRIRNWFSAELADWAPLTRLSH